jgi:hypothetical protein
MQYSRHGGGWQAFDGNSELVHSEYGRQADKEHKDNFIDCIRTRKQPNANAVVGHQTALLCHMANISYRVGNKQLDFDPKTETFTNNDQANKYLGRTYRKRTANRGSCRTMCRGNPVWLPGSELCLSRGERKGRPHRAAPTRT